MRRVASLLVVSCTVVLSFGCNKGSSEKTSGVSGKTSGKINDRIMEVVATLQNDDINAYIEKSNSKIAAQDNCEKNMNTSLPDFEKKVLMTKCIDQEIRTAYQPGYTSDFFKKTAKYEFIEKKNFAENWDRYYVKISYASPTDCYTPPGGKKVKELVATFDNRVNYDLIRHSNTSPFTVLSEF